MKKKLDTRFPAVRIKKIMQTDEEVGKMAMAVPLLVSKALELFLQDLCDKTYEITVKRGAKTLSSAHLKQCVQTISAFDFLSDTVSKVQDLGGSTLVGEDQSISVIKRRRVVGDEKSDSHVELKKTRKIEAGEPTSGVQGQGRRRGRPRKRTVAEQNENTHDNLDGPKTEAGGSDSDIKDSLVDIDKLKENIRVPSRDFDLNVDLDENGDLKGEPHASSEADLKHGMEHEEFQGWSVSEVEKMGINTMQLSGLNKTIEEDEDYDEEG